MTTTTTTMMMNFKAQKAVPEVDIIYFLAFTELSARLVVDFNSIK